MTFGLWWIFFLPNDLFFTKEAIEESYEDDNHKDDVSGIEMGCFVEKKKLNDLLEEAEHGFE